LDTVVEVGDYYRTLDAQRNIIFISHATPEDNHFSQWLALQLTRRGYETWCDVTKLLGGENWWRDIDGAIRTRACKFLFVASEVSVKKNGVIRELKLALPLAAELTNFVIPIKLDGVPYKDFPEGIGSELNAVNFSHGWAPGLARLLQRLEEDNVSKKSHFSPELVSDYWRKSFPAEEGVKAGNEEHVSNWFPISEYPDNIVLHVSSGFAQDGFKVDQFRFPAEKHGDNLLTFLSASELRPLIREAGIRVRASNAVPFKEFLDRGSYQHGIRGTEARNLVHSMLRKAWDQNAVARGFRTYELANAARCYWLEKGFSKSDESEFVGIDGKKQRRQLVGFKNFHVAPGSPPRQRLWHFAIQGRPMLHPEMVFSMRTHVVFTEDGKTPIDSDARQHSARRSQCKSWWNDTWRDRLLAIVAALRNPRTNKIVLQLSPSESAVVDTSPVKFNAPVSYAPVESIPLEDLPDDPDEEEEPEEGAEEET
jgi:hypothetical protein